VPPSKRRFGRVEAGRGGNREIGMRGGFRNASGRRKCLFRSVSARGQFDQGDHVSLEIIRDCGVGFQLGQRPRTRQRFAVLLEAFRIQFQRFGRVAQRLVNIIAAGGAAGQVWKPDANGVVRSCIFNQGDVVAMAAMFLSFSCDLGSSQKPYTPRERTWLHQTHSLIVAKNQGVPDSLFIASIGIKLVEGIGERFVDPGFADKRFDGF
jgi:hypothetical protein